MPEVTFSADRARAGTEAINAWVEFVSPSGTTYYWSGVAMAHDAAYYGGFKEARVLSFGQWSRPMSDRAGQYSSATFSFALSDVDRLLRGFLDDASANRALRNCEVIIRALSDVDRRAGLTPRIIARGVVRNYTPQAKFGFQFECEDFLASVFGAARLDAQIPRRLFALTQFPSAATTVIGQPEPIVYGDMSGGGPVYPIPVGYVTLGGISYLQCVLAGHACKSVPHYYFNGTLQDIYCDAGNAALVPGHGGWAGFFGTPYIDIAGRRYTCIYLSGDLATGHLNGTYISSCDVQGVESVGDGSGTLYTAIADQYEHFLRCFGLNNYQTGAWLAAPTWADGTSKLLSASFAAAKTISQVRLAPNGYVGAGIIGAFGEGQVTLRDAIARFNLSCDADCYFTRAMQFAIAMVDASAAATLTLDDVNDILDGGFEIAHLVEEYYSAVVYSYARDYLYQRWAVENLHLRDTGASGEPSIAPATELWFVRASTVAHDIGLNRLTRAHDVPRRVRVQTGMHGLNVELGDVVGVTHVEGTGNSGWTNRKTRAELAEGSLDDNTVTLTCRDIAAYAVPTVVEEPGAVTMPGSAVYGGAPLPPGSVTIINQIGAYDMGGSRSQYVDGAGAHDAYEYRDWTVDWSKNAGRTARVIVDVKGIDRAGAALGTVQAIVHAQAGGGGVDYTVTAVSSAAWTQQVIQWVDPDGVSTITYRLRVNGSDANGRYAVKSNPGAEIL